MDKKKVTAAMSAVMTYRKTQEEAAYAQSLRADRPKRPNVPNGLWGMSGRQAQMQMRSMLQMKSFHGSKLR